jgi:predicted RNA binding protein YcfA (HicA-like mRNA interferase family)
MPKASRVLAALKRDGWVETRRSGSHRTLVRGDRVARWAFHDGRDLGRVHMAQIGAQFGYTREELARIV